MASLLDTLFGNESPKTSGQPAYGPSPSAPMPAPAPSSGVSAGGSNPFSSVFASDAGGLRGLIGQLSGAPTQGEIVQRRLGAQQAQGLAGLEQRMKSGMPMRQALTDFIGSPEGMNFFGSSQDPMAVLRAYIATTHPVPQYDTVGPNQTVFNKTTGQLTDQHTSSPQVQDITDLGHLADATPSQVREIATATLQHMANPNSTEAERGFKVLVDKKLFTPEDAAKITSGIVKVIPTTDKLTGNPNGAIMLDLTKYMETQDPKDLVPVILGANNGGINGDGGADTKDRNTPPVPGDIIFGAGPGAAAGAIGGITGVVSSELGATTTNKYRDQLNTIFGDVTRLAGSGRPLSTAFDYYAKAVDKSGLFSNAGAQAQALINLRETVDRHMVQAGITLHDANTGPDARQEAAKDIADLRTLNADLPSMADLQASFEKYKAGQGTLPDLMQEGVKKVGAFTKGLGTAVQAGKDLLGATENAVGDHGTNQGANAPQEFKNEQDAATAANNGTLKPDASGKITVIINGVTRTFSRKGAK